jgi:hypothetical protein
MVYSGAWGGGELIHEKDQKSKISWHCPFNLPEVAGLFFFLSQDEYQYDTSEVKAPEKKGTVWDFYNHKSNSKNIFGVLIFNF